MLVAHCTLPSFIISQGIVNSRGTICYGLALQRSLTMNLSLDDSMVFGIRYLALIKVVEEPTPD